MLYEVITLHQDCDVEITDDYHWKPQDEIKRCCRNVVPRANPTVPPNPFCARLSNPEPMRTSSGASGDSAAAVAAVRSYNFV